MEGLEKEDLRAVQGCNLFRACIEDCSNCLFRTLDDDIENNILYNSDDRQYDPDDWEFNFV